VMIRKSNPRRSLGLRREGRLEVPNRPSVWPADWERPSGSITNRLPQGSARQAAPQSGSSSTDELVVTRFTLVPSALMV
jgi:hypothetical protein